MSDTLPTVKCELDDACCDERHNPLWLFLWGGLYVIPLTLYFTLKGTVYRKGPAWRLNNLHVRLIVALSLAVLTAVAAPFVPEEYAGNADLTVFFLGLYQLAEALNDMVERWKKSNLLKHIYSASSKIVNMHMKEPLVPLESRKQVSDLPAELRDKETTHYSKLQMQQLQMQQLQVQGTLNDDKRRYWLPSNEIMLEMGLEKYMASVEKPDNHGPRYMLLPLYISATEFSQMQYSLGPWDASLMVEVFNVRDSGVQVRDWRDKTEEYLVKALELSKVQRWLDSHRKCDKISHFTITSTELEKHEGITQLMEMQPLKGLKDLVPQAGSHSGQIPRQWVQDADKFRKTILLDLLVLAFELTAMSDFNSTQKREPPLAQTLMRAYFTDGRMDGAKMTETISQEQDALWLSWAHAVSVVIPTILLLVFATIVDNVNRSLCAEVLAACVRQRMAEHMSEFQSHGLIKGTFSDRRGLSTWKGSVKVLAEKASKFEAICNEVELLAAQKVLEVAEEHTRKVFDCPVDRPKEQAMPADP